MAGTPASSRTITTALLADGAVTAAKLTTGLRVLTEIFDSTLLVDTAAFDTGANGVPGTLDALLVVAHLRTTEAITASNARITFNNDTGANYDEQRVTGASVTASAGSSVGQAAISYIVAGASDATGAFAAMVLWIPDYAGTVAEKSVIGLSGYADETAVNSNLMGKVGHWRSTAAISRLAVTAASGDFLTGSRVTVYGIG